MSTIFSLVYQHTDFCLKRNIPYYWKTVNIKIYIISNSNGNIEKTDFLSIELLNKNWKNQTLILVYKNNYEVLIKRNKLYCTVHSAFRVIRCIWYFPCKNSYPNTDSSMNINVPICQYSVLRQDSKILSR